MYHKNNLDLDFKQSKQLDKHKKVIKNNVEIT